MVANQHVEVPEQAQRRVDPRLCAAIVDQLSFAGDIVETGTDSYRLAHARAQCASAS